MTQTTLFPIHVRNLVPANFKTADLQYIAQGDDTQDYAVKESSAANPELPATEYLSYRLAAACELAMPASAVLAMPDGSLAFGSRFEGGVAQMSIMTVDEREQAITTCGPHMSALCTLDLFLANDDRHLDNALYRKSPFGGHWTLLAMDFSRALWIGGFPAMPCGNTASSGNTSGVISIVKAYNAWEDKRCKNVAATLLSITPDTISSWIADLPADWQTPKVLDLPKWWGSSSRPDRIKELLTVL